jgi:hypothetical protein
MNLRECALISGGLAVFIRHDSAEITRFRYGFTSDIGTLKIMARTGVFVSVVRSLKRSISGLLWWTPGII